MGRDPTVVSRWGEVFVDRVLATAIAWCRTRSRIAINIRGHSYRLKEKLKAGLVRMEEASPAN